MKRQFLVISMLILGQALIFAQIDVSGTVIDQTGLGLPGVNVSVQGTTVGGVTNLDGQYNLTVPDGNSIIEFTYVGYLKQEIGVGNQTEINVTLQEDVLGLEEVVVIGYGTTRKMDVTGAVATLSGDDIAEIPTPNFEEGMQGKIPGLEMKRTSAEPGGGISVKIRGTNSLLGNNEPLFVIDGFPMINDNQSRPGGWEQQEPLNLLSSLNPNDIESVQVLKDASATAIYGSRGANGVIIITTKSGQKGKAMVDFEYSHSISQVNHNFEFSNVEQYTTIENQALFNNQGASTPAYRYTAADLNAWGLDNTPQELAALYGEGTNWLDEVLQIGHVNNYNLSIQGGDARTTYMISTNYYDEQGVIIESGYKKGTIRANVNSQVLDRLKVGVNMSASRYNSDRFAQAARLTGGGPDRLGVITEAFRANPMTTPETPHLEPNDLLQYAPGTANVTNFIYNPVQEAQKRTNTEGMNFFLGTLNAELELVDGLKLVGRAGYNFQSQERTNFLPMSTPVGYWWGAIGSHSFYDNTQFVWENYLNYAKTFGGVHNIDFTAGYSFEQTRIQNKSMSGDKFNFDAQGIYGWNNMSVPAPMQISESQRSLASFYGRFFYNHSDRYMVTFTGRQDGSSVFAENNKTAFFPSGAVAWVISQEAFMDGADWLSNLKLRGSYGIVGNQAIGPYGSLAKVRTSAGHVGQGYTIGGSKNSGLVPWTAANPDLRWESTKQLDIGVDAAFLAGRVRFSADWYKKNTIDLLQNKPVPMLTGYNTFTSNFGEISNTGVELMIGGSPSIGSFGWNTTLTFSYNRNVIEDLGLDAEGEPLKVALAPGGAGGASPRFVLGEPIGTFWGTNWLGMVTAEDVAAGDVAFSPGLDEPGDMKFEDQLTVDTDGDGVPDAPDGVINASDAYVIGTAQPDFIFGWDNTFTYGNFTLNLFINGVIGGSVWNSMRQYTHSGNALGAGGRHSKEYAENHWTESNLDAPYPRPGGFGGGSNYFLESASFVRLQTASLMYRIPAEKISWMRNASVYVRGSNLFVITDYSGFDPETSFRGQSDASQNIDLGNYPRPWTVEFGVKLGF
ncbi:MAG: TonB-dependent receptor [Bacteroidetes bacterium]|nr:TonB-dependent receptor [Bacteroidota bacterium]